MRVEGRRNDWENWNCPYSARLKILIDGRVVDGSTVSGTLNDIAKVEASIIKHKHTLNHSIDQVSLLMIE